MRGSLGSCAVLRATCALAVLAAGGVAGCGGSGETAGPPRHRIVDPGDGPENDAPLFPLRVGLRRVLPGNPTTRRNGDASDWAVAFESVVTGRVEKWGKTLWRYQATEGVRYFSETAEGVFWDGSTAVGRLPRPILIVPAVVRDGMEWEVWQDGDEPSGVYRVASVAMEDTLLGRTRVWAIEQTTYPAGDWSETQTIWYAEGLGPVRQDTTSYEGHYRIAVTPLEDVAVPAEPPDLSLEPLNGGAPVVEDLAAEDVGATLAADGSGWTFRLGGHRTLEQSDAFGRPVVTARGAVTCASWDGSSFAVTGHGIADTTTPTFVGWEGEPCIHPVAQVPDDGSPAGPDLDPQGRMALYVSPTTPPRYDSAGTYLDAAGEPAWLKAGWEARYVDSDALAAQGAATLAPWPYLNALRRAVIEQATPSAELPFAIATGDLLLSSAIRGPVIERLRLAATVAGERFGATLDATAREHWMVAQDGLLHRIRFEGEALKVEAMGRLPIPEGEEVAGSVAVGGDLITFTTSGEHVPMDPYSDDPYSGDVRAWRTPRPSLPAGAPVRDPTQTAARSLWVTASGLDLVVCWPPGSGEAVLEGWTLGGHPATAVSGADDGSCIVVVRDKTQPVALDRENLFAAEGTVPDLGRVAIGHARAMAAESAPPVPAGVVAALAPAGATTNDVSFDPGLHPVAAPLRPSPLATARPPLWADPDGHGLWSRYPSPLPLHECPSPWSDCVDLWMVGPHPVRHVLPSNPDATHADIWGFVRGGGIWGVNRFDADPDWPYYYALLPDGTQFPVLAMVDYSRRRLIGVQSDRAAWTTDDACIPEDGMTCDRVRWAPDGTSRVVGRIAPEHLVRRNRWFPGADGWYAFGDGTGSYIPYEDGDARAVDFSALGGTELAIGYSAAFSSDGMVFSADGRLYAPAFAAGDARPRWLVGFDEERIVPIEIPIPLGSDSLPLPVNLDAGFVIDRDVIVLNGTGGWPYHTWRFPRPAEP
jgi:hypothetical protein